MPRKRLTPKVEVIPKGELAPIPPERPADLFGRYLRNTATIADEAPEYLEARRMLLVKEIEEVADAALARGDLELRLTSLMSLVRLTSLHKATMDAAATDPGLMKQPNLSQLTAEELEAIKRADNETLGRLASNFKVKSE